jgi:hypothetical protein
MATPNSAGTPAITSNSSSSKRSKDGNDFQRKKVLYPYKSPSTNPSPRYSPIASLTTMGRDGSEFNSNVYVSNIRASFEGARPRASFEPELRTKQYDMEMVSVKARR